MKKLCAYILLAALLCTAALAYEATGDYGVNYIERMGIGFSLSDAMTLKKGDLLEAKVSSGIAIGGDDMRAALNENSIVKVDDADPLKLTLEAGELYLQADAGSGVTLSVGNVEYDVSGCTLIADVQTGSFGMTLLEGSLDELAAGSRLSDSNGEVNVSDTSAQSMDDFAIGCALGSTRTLCFDAAALQGVLDAREAEKLAALEELEAHEAAIIAQGGTVKNGSSSSGSTGNGATDGSGICTIQIRCDTILNNMGNLTDGKNAYVPKNGVILATSKVSFSEGETVFDVLKRVCSAAGIQIEYSYTPMYGSYYIEGINHLYEFDCGSESGWMYKVNGWFPNYGCSSYTLKDGDTIVWCYTCKGLGADVGGSVY